MAKRKKGAAKSRSRKSGKGRGGAKKSGVVAKITGVLKRVPKPVIIAGVGIVAIFGWNAVAQARAAGAASAGGATTPPVLGPAVKDKLRLRGLSGLGVYGAP